MALWMQSPEKLDMLSGFKTRWNEFEKPYNTPPSFHSWFVKHCRNNVANYMLQHVREKAGLGSPPTPYYTNEVESKNKLLKEEVQYKSSQLPEFVEKMKRLMEGQRREVERAIIGSGEYRLKKEYSNLAVESSKWFRMTTEQCQRKIDKFMKAPAQVDQQPSHSSCPLDILPLPSQLKESLWEKANDLAKDGMAIVRAPGDGDESAWMVKSYSGKRPHFVKVTKCTFACDEQCLSYKSMKLCSHTIALAIKKDCMEQFLKWYRTMKHQPNFTTLAEAGKPSMAGKKPTRKGVSKKGAEHIQKIVTDAEECNSAWQSRGSHSGVQTSFTDYLLEYDFSSGGPNPTLLQDSLHSVSHPATTTTLVMRPRHVHSINIGNVGGIVSGPPPLIPTEFGQSVHQPSSTSSSYAVPQQSNFVIPPNFFVPRTSNSNVLVAQPSPTSSFVVPQHSPNSNLVLQPSPISPSQQRPHVDTPFWLVFIFGNVSRCNGCKGRISRGEDKKPLPPPNDIVLGHKEYIIYQNSKSENFEQSRDKRNVYYHPWKTCIAPYFCNFDPCQHISVPDSVSEKLQAVHKAFILKEFGVYV